MNIVSVLVSHARSMVRHLTHACLQSLYALKRKAMVSEPMAFAVDSNIKLNDRGGMKVERTYWKKSEQSSLSPPLRCKHRMLRDAASWHGS